MSLFCVYVRHTFCVYQGRLLGHSFNDKDEDEFQAVWGILTQIMIIGSERFFI